MTKLIILLLLPLSLSGEYQHGHAPEHIRMQWRKEEWAALPVEARERILSLPPPYMLRPNPKALITWTY